MSKKITAIIVDDERDARDGLESLINNILPNLVIIAKSENAQNALEIIIDKQPEIIFLDIQMPVNDGFWLAEKLTKLQIDTCIIFITGYDEYAIKAIKYAAFDLLTKPIDTDELIKSIEKYTTNVDGNNLSQKVENLKLFFKQDRLKIDTIYGFVMVDPNNIIYCEGDDKYCNIHLTNGKTEMATTQLDEVESVLAKKTFVKINQSILVNLDYLESYTDKTKTVILSDVLQKYEFKADLAGARKLKAE